MSWFEEPVSSDDLDGLRLLRDRAPAGMDDRRRRVRLRAAYFRRMLAAGAVDVLQADVTRCGGITGLLARRRALPGAPAAALGALRAVSCTRTPCCAIGPLRHLEYFHDHARIERMLFDGALEPRRRRAAARPRPSRARASSSRPPTRSASPHEEARRMIRPQRRVARRCATCAAAARSGCCPAPPRPPRCRSGVEIYVNHYGGSFGNKWMWTPVVAVPGAGGRGRRRGRLRARGADLAAGALGALHAQRRRRASTCTCAGSRASRAACARPPTTSSWARRCWRPDR